MNSQDAWELELFEVGIGCSERKTLKTLTASCNEVDPHIRHPKLLLRSITLRYLSEDVRDECFAEPRSNGYGEDAHI